MTEQEHKQETDAQRDDEQDVSTDHLDDMEDGCGCAEVWEHMSERREDAADD
ncbi:hypothetical protein [Halorientalis marina]|jgi:hypothetical protein|uniref:hypothetical protein n=1 Tax=Halorientalis marina TaxID=2931976 RepID=UPI001FF3937C|nr:hypothetical protein [Halorientalis marina]